MMPTSFLWGIKMKSTDKQGRKSSEKIKEEIINDWADVRRWIDELQTEWSERQRLAQTKITQKTRGKRSSSLSK